MSARKILFIDRDGTLIVEPPDEQIDSFEKLALVDGVIPALRRCVAAGYELVMVTNQDGLGTQGFPQAAFDGPQKLLLQILASQGVTFRDIVIDRSFPHEGRDTRKPGVGLMRKYLADDGWIRAGSAVIGDRETDLQFAANLGVRGFRLGPAWSWDVIAHVLCDAPRTGAVERATKETRIRASVDLDRAVDPVVATGIGFFDHMLEQLGKHGGFALTLTCAGDTHVDEHHVVEDCALALGAALRQALGDKRGIARYGQATEIDEGAAVGSPELQRGEDQERPLTPTLYPNDGAVRGEGAEKSNDGAVREEGGAKSNDGAVRGKGAEKSNNKAVRGEGAEKSNDGAVRGEGAEKSNDGAVRGEGVGAAGDETVRGMGAKSLTSVLVLLPMDESLARAALDLSGRPFFVFEGAFARERVGELPTELVPHFFRSLCETLGANLHLAVRGENAHHMVEACFKATARALRQALKREGATLPSTKGVL